MDDKSLRDDVDALKRDLGRLREDLTGISRDLLSAAKSRVGEVRTRFAAYAARSSGSSDTHEDGSHADSPSAAGFSSGEAVFDPMAPDAYADGDRDARSAAEQGYEQAAAAGRDAYRAVNDAIRQHPLASLTAAVGIGVLLGSALRRR